MRGSGEQDDEHFVITCRYYKFNFFFLFYFEDFILNSEYCIQNLEVAWQQ